MHYTTKKPEKQTFDQKKSRKLSGIKFYQRPIRLIAPVLRNVDARAASD